MRDDLDNERASKKSHVASQALVFLVNAINDSFQLPIAYYFINSMQANEKQELVLKIIEQLIDCGVTVKNLTFDGFRANITMCKLFGATLNVYSPEFKPYITVRGVRIYIFMDSCHMLKLVRNKLSDKGILYDANGNAICWQYFISDLI